MSDNLLEDEEPKLSRSRLSDLSDISIGEPRKLNRDSHYVYPLLVKGYQYAEHRYSDFVDLRESLSKEHPGSVTSGLPEKEGVNAYWGSQDPMFYSFRRFGLEQFLRRVATHPRLSQSSSFLSFVKGNGGLPEGHRKGWIDTFSNWGSSVTTLVSGYIYKDQVVLQNEADNTFNQYRNEIHNYYQQQTTLCKNGQEMVRQLEAEINSNFALSKAYENLGKVENEPLGAKMRVMADTHYRIADTQKESFTKIKALVGQDMEDVRRYITGLLEAFDRRNALRVEEINRRAVGSLEEVDQDLLTDIERFHQERAFLNKSICNQIVLYKQEVAEKIAQVWREAYETLNPST